jgi:cell division protein FtsB
MVQKVSLILLLGCLYFLTVMLFSDRGILQYRQLTQQIIDIQNKKSALTQSIKAGKESIQKAEDPAYIEEQARLRHGLVKTDETVYWLSK